MRKSLIAGLSWLQLIAGALAAMTSAWVASYLGVAGTIIGAAVGSLVASVASALYVRGLDRGTTIITKSGSVVSRAAVVDQDTEPAAEVDVAQEDEAVLEDAQGRFWWKRILVWAGASLAAALLLIGGYEFVTGWGFGNADNPSIGRPWTATGTSGDQQQPDRDGTERTTAPTEDAPSSSPTTVPTSVPTPDPAPTETAPAPSPEPVPDAPEPPTADGE